jgi:hypothetical protein
MTLCKPESSVFIQFRVCERELQSRIHTEYTQNIHRIHTEYTQNIHRIHASYTQNTHRIYT